MGFFVMNLYLCVAGIKVILSTLSICVGSTFPSFVYKLFDKTTMSESVFCTNDQLYI